MSVRRSQQVSRLGLPALGASAQMIDVDPVGDTIEYTTTTGTGAPVRASGATITSPSIATALTLNYGTPSLPVILNASRQLIAATQTGTGTTFAMSASPTFTGTVSAAAITASGTVTAANFNTGGRVTSTAAGSGGYMGAVVIQAGTGTNDVAITTVGANTSTRNISLQYNGSGVVPTGLILPDQGIVYAGAGATGGLLIREDGGSGIFIQTNATQRAIFFHTGGFAIGSTTNNGYMLEVTGSTHFVGSVGVGVGGSIGFDASATATTPYPLAMETMTDANKALAIGTCAVSTSTAFTAPRVVTIPNLTGLPPRIITIADTGGAVSALNTLSVSTTQAINGGTGANIIATAYRCIVYFWNGTAFTVVSIA